MLPRGKPDPHSKRDLAAPSVPLEEDPSGRTKTLLLALLTAIFTLNSGLVTVISVHLISILQTHGMGLAAAVALGALLGPSQVVSRLLELVFGRYYQPLWTMTASLTLIAAGLSLMLGQFRIVSATLVIYGFGVGLGSIARGTVPLRLFGPLGYATLMGRLAMFPLLSQALCPWLASFLMADGDAKTVLSIIMAAALCNVVLAALLWTAAKRSHSG